ncbi:MAG TPA: PLDc N-terminal domain-containing protein [Gaiellaceae bacterium]|jgi:hypothetical protein
MGWFWWLLGVIVVILWVATIVDIIRRRHSMSPVAIAAWLIIVLVFPVLGTIIYFLGRGAAGSTAAGTRSPRQPT